MAPERFTQEVVGLDHVGFVCASRDELDDWNHRMDTHNVEHSDIVESPFGWHLNFRGPDGIPMEGRIRPLGYMVWWTASTLFPSGSRTNAP